MNHEERKSYKEQEQKSSVPTPHKKSNDQEEHRKSGEGPDNKHPAAGPQKKSNDSAEGGDGTTRHGDHIVIDLNDEKKHEHEHGDKNLLEGANEKDLENAGKTWSKIINLRKFIPPPEPEELPKPETPPEEEPQERRVSFLDEDTIRKLEDNEEDLAINEQLSEIMDHYRGEKKQQARKAKKNRYPKYKYPEIVSMLTKQGIPIPSDDDFARLEATHGTRWDPDGTVVEYYSPVLRSFLPINMRGRYRGCWLEDHCIQGLDISKLKPKPDALEGFIDRERQSRIEMKYNEMSTVATDAAHLDYLIEMQKFQSEILPIPIFYDVLNFGSEILNESMKILIKEERISPNNRIYRTSEDQEELVRKKIAMYMGLGLEPLDSTRPGMGRVDPQWEKTRDELISGILARRHKDQIIQSENAKTKLKPGPSNKKLNDKPSKIDNKKSQAKKS